jgi:hypothetical protein
MCPKTLSTHSRVGAAFRSCALLSLVVKRRAKLNSINKRREGEKKTVFIIFEDLTCIVEAKKIEGNTNLMLFTFAYIRLILLQTKIGFIYCDPTIEIVG